MLDLFRAVFAPPRDLILILAAMWVGLSLVEKRLLRDQRDAEPIHSLIFAALLGYLLGGRVFYIAGHISEMLQDPWAMISLNLNLFDPLGALASAGIAGVAYGRRAGLALWPTLDALTPFFAATAVGIALSHLASGLAFGRITDLPWAWQLWGARRHPSQAYELLASLLVVGLLWTHKPSLPGTHFLYFLALTSGWRLFLEAFRAESTLIAGGLRATQVVAWILLASAVFGLEFMENQKAAQNS